MGNIRQWIDEAYKTACDKGWHETRRNPYEIHALIHSEVAETTECARSRDLPFSNKGPWIKGMKPEGEDVELVDAVIRICDYVGELEANNATKKIDWALDDFVNNPLTDGYVEDCKNNPLFFHQIVHNQIARSATDAYHYHVSSLIGVIRAIAKYFAIKGWDLSFVVEAKMEFNKSREYRHGNKKF